MATEAESRPFNAASFYAFLQEGRFMGVRCRENGNLYAEARPLDPVSHSRDMEWHEFSGRATLSTFTCISVAPASLEAKGFGRNNPYCTGIVTLEEGPRISAQDRRRGCGQPAEHTDRHGVGNRPDGNRSR